MIRGLRVSDGQAEMWPDIVQECDKGWGGLVGLAMRRPLQDVPKAWACMSPSLEPCSHGGRKDGCSTSLPGRGCCCVTAADGRGD